MQAFLVATALVAGSLSIGCASTPVAPPEPARPYITLEKEPEGEAWRATWHLDRPARALRFERKGAGFRSDLFEVLTSGFTMQRDGDFEVLRTSGEPVSTISVRFPEFTRKLEKEYEFFQKFSDGSVAIYTGHLVARPLHQDDAPDCPECYIRRFRFIGPAGTPLVVGGRVVSSPFDWRDEGTQGAYIYFGLIEPVESEEMISIIDPALPAWLFEETTAALPRLFAMYTERFGVELEERPTILFNYIDSGYSGYSSGGGTLPGQIQLTVDGAAWKERAQPALLNLFHFLAHEAVHIWNGQIINYRGTEDSWMHEGSADAFAQRTLLELGLIDEASFLDYQSAALNECRKRLEAFPLREAGARKEFLLYYSCGNAIALVTEARSGERDLFAFWKRLIDRSIESGTYDSEDYFAVWADSGATAEDIESLRRFVERRADGDDLVAMLSASGVELADDAEPPGSYSQSVARDSLLALLSEHCKGPYGFNVSEGGLALTESNQCGTIPGGGLVTSIAGFGVFDEGHRTWDALHERCGSGAPVTLGVRVGASEETIEVSCTGSFAPRPAWVKVESRPR